MRIRRGFASARAVVGAIVLAFGATPLAAQATFPLESEAIKRLYPTAAVSKTDIALLQDALFDNACYGNQLTHSGEVDEEFGPQSKKALHVFVEAYNRTTRPGKKVLNSWSDVRDEASKETDSGARLCASPRAQSSVARFFTDKTDHDPAASRVGRAEWREIHQNLYPRPQDRAEIELLRDALFDNSCYGNKITRQDESNQPFGPRAKKALHVFVETYYRQFRPSKPFANAKDVQEAADSVRRLCVNSQYRALYFSNRREHVGGGSARPSALTCSKSDVETNYLSSISQNSSSAAGLTKSLADIVESFATIFPDAKLDYYTGYSKYDQALLDKKGIKGFSYGETKDALNKARSLFSRLAFLNGIERTPACKMCYKINEWMFLNSIAQASAGYLISTTTTAVSKSGEKVDLPIRSVAAASITEPMLDTVMSNIKLYRSYALKYIEIVSSMTAGTAAPGDDREKAAKALEGNRKAILLDRDNEFNLIVLGLHSARENLQAVKGTAMKEIAARYQCVGFDGSNVFDLTAP